MIADRGITVPIGILVLVSRPVPEDVGAGGNGLVACDEDDDNRSSFLSLTCWLCC